MARTRNYQADYQRRVASAAKRGLSRSQARGHAKTGETPMRPTAPKDAEKLEAAFKSMRQSGSQAAAAKAYNISPERLRRFIRDNELAERSGRTWAFTDGRSREMQVISDGKIQLLKLAGFDQASLNGQHLTAVKAFLSSNDFDLLTPFVGQTVIDATGKSHPLETNPNILHRLDSASAGDEGFHDIYRLIM